MNIKRPIPLFAVAVALPSAFSYGCNDDRQGLDEGGYDDEYVCCTNEGWYPLDGGYDTDTGADGGDVYDEPYYSTNEGWYPLDGGYDTDVGVDAADADADVPDTDADDVYDEPYYSTNEGWYPLDGGYDADADAGDAGSYDAGEGSGADATDGDTGASLTPSGLDWEALAWCAPDPARPGLRAYRRIPSPFVVADEEPA